jgi:hypothetical protein
MFRVWPEAVCLWLQAANRPPKRSNDLWLKSVLAVNAPHLYRATRPWRRVRRAACEDVAAGVLPIRWQYCLAPPGRRAHGGTSSWQVPVWLECESRCSSGLDLR